MVPKLTFEAIDNPEGMIRLMNNFLIYSGKGFDWSKIYAKEYPDFGKLIKKLDNSEDLRKISSSFFKELYYYQLSNLKKIAKSFQLNWDKDGSKLLLALSKVVEKEWTEDCKEMKAWISLNPICPRFLEQRAFDVYWKLSNNEMKETCLHEILHFIWFEKWKEVFPNYNEREFESPHLIWKLSEIVPFAVLGDKRVQKVFKHIPSVYPEWTSKKIEGKLLLECIQEIYDQRNSFEEFLIKSWEFVQRHSSEI
ncbi:MAG: hypothetical protein AABX66_01255 [Nanoarchaeota archaeon]